MFSLLVVAAVAADPADPRGCNVRDHGARGDNTTEDTAAFLSALSACESGGGATVVPPGTYLLRPVRLPSHAHLLLLPGSTLAAWGDRYTWPNSTMKACDFAPEGSGCCLNSLKCCVPQKESLLWATNATNVTISGGGVIDGNAQHNDWHRGAGNVSADGKHFARYYDNYWHMCRPRMVEVRWSTDIRLDNITILNSIMFNIHTAHVAGLKASNITIHSLGPNTDGFNIAGTDMHITDSSVCNNDDCIPVNAPTDGLVVERTNCVCQWGGGFVPMIGDTDTSWGADCLLPARPGGKTTCSPSGDIANVTFRDGYFNQTSTAVIMKSMPMFHGTIRDVTYENLALHSVRTGVCINTAAQECYNRAGGGDVAGGGGWLNPAVHWPDWALNVAAQQNADGVGRGAGSGLSTMNVRAITIRNVTGNNVGLAGYLNCPVNDLGNCTEISLDGISFPGAKPYFCSGTVRGESKDCSPPACPLLATPDVVVPP